MASENDSLTETDSDGARRACEAPRSHGFGAKAPLSSRLEGGLQTCRSIATSVFVISGVVALWVAFFLGLTPKSVLIEPIHVPTSLQEKGYTSEVIANHIIDHIAAIKEISSTRTAREGDKLLPSWGRPDIEFRSDTSLQSVHNYARSLLNLDERRVSGEIVATTHGYRLYLRDNIGGRIAEVNYETETRGRNDGAGQLDPAELEAILRNGAEHLLRTVDPYILAVYSQDKGETERATELVSSSVKNGTIDDDPWAYNLWGLILQAQNKHDSALKKYEAAIELRQDFRPAYLNKGIALSMAARLNMQDIEEHFTKTARMFPGDPEVYRQWGLSLARIAYYERAREKFGKAALLASGTGAQSADIHMDYGATVLRYADLLLKSVEEGIGDFAQPQYGEDLLTEAIEQFQHVIKLDRRNDGAYLNLGFAFERMGKYDLALESFISAKDLEGEYEEHARNQISSILRTMAQLSEERAMTEAPVKSGRVKIDSKALAESFGAEFIPVMVEQH